MDNEKKEEIKNTEEKKESDETTILKNFFIGLGAVVALLLLIMGVQSSFNNFEYEGVPFSKEKFCDSGPCLNVYRTSLPLKHTDKMTGKVTNSEYNFYIRNDPRELGKIPFEGELFVAKMAVLNATSDFNCNGDGIISIANMKTPLDLLGVKTIKDENADCDAEGNYMFINIQEGNETNIIQTGPACYEMNVKDCEILKATERFMLEIFIKLNKEY